MKRIFLLLFSIYLAVLFCNDFINAQEAPETQEFPIGAFMSILRDSTYKEVLYNTYKASGMNIIVPRADADTKNFLTDLDVIPWNQSDDDWSDWIQYYITGYYSKWEAEENQQDDNVVGVKHRYGQTATWQGISCWSSIGLSSPKDSLLFGPHYHQEKVYRRFLINNSRDLSYTPRIRMALHNPEEVSGNEDVCRIKVVHRYKIYHSINNATLHETTLLQRILKVSDFDNNGNFSDFYFGVDPTSYTYDQIFPTNELNYYNRTQSTNFPIYSDLESDLGIQFSVDWLRNDPFCTLYIDYAEVYDNDGWNQYIETPGIVINRIQDYTESYSSWNNIKYWYGHDEPFTIDAIVPMQVVDSLVRDAGGAPIVTAFLIGPWPYWSPVNGELLYKRIYEAVQPENLMVDYYPFYTDDDLNYRLEVLRAILQETHTMDPNFWYIGQAFGQYGEEDCLWRTPDTTELKASVMLSLAQGVKGLLFWNFESGEPQNQGECYSNGILDLELNTTELYDVIKDNLAPRLKGTLGKKLLGLNYTGDYLQLQYFTPTLLSPPPPAEHDYLTLGVYAYANDMNWHAGFFERPNHPDDKYFMLVNLLTTANKSIDVKVTPPVQGYVNYRFREIEGAFDETFTTQIIKQITHVKGEGKLYQVAPVVKYGGTLAVNDTVSSTITLLDKMTISNGAELYLSVNADYFLTDTVTLEGTGFIKGIGYVFKDSTSDIITNDWSRSLFKSRQGNRPKIFWGEFADTVVVDNYKIYREKQTPGFEHIATVSANQREYIDSATTIITGPPNMNETIADYYVVAVYYLSGGGRDPYDSAPSNTITYQRVAGEAPQKQASGTDIAYTYSLSENYPNPFNPSTVIKYSVADLTDVRLVVYDILGREIKLLVDENKEPGNYEVHFNAENLASGVYIYRMDTKNFSKSYKMMLVK